MFFFLSLCFVRAFVLVEVCVCFFSRLNSTFVHGQMVQSKWISIKRNEYIDKHPDLYIYIEWPFKQSVSLYLQPALKNTHNSAAGKHSHLIVVTAVACWLWGIAYATRHHLKLYLFGWFFRMSLENCVR